MSISLRVLLIVSAAVVLLFVVRKLKKSQMQVLDSLFWLLFSLSFVMLGIFPEIAVACSELFGFVSPSNCRSRCSRFLQFTALGQVGGTLKLPCSSVRFR